MELNLDIQKFEILIFPYQENQNLKVGTQKQE